MHLFILDFDPWEISKDGLEELIQNQNESETGATTTTTSVNSQPNINQSSFQISSHFQVGIFSIVINPSYFQFVTILINNNIQVQNNFINHMQQSQKTDPSFLFQNFGQQNPHQSPFTPFNLGIVERFVTLKSKSESSAVVFLLLMI